VARVDGWKFQTSWWQLVPKLISSVDKVYNNQEAKGKSGKWLATKKKIYSERNWESSISLIEKNFESVLEKLNFFYVPKGFEPGPMFVFPQKDVEDEYTRAQTRPLYEIISQDGTSSKYRVIGVPKDQFLGPVWLGNDDDTLKLIMEKGHVVLVEGPFDLLAVRLLCPDIPSMSPLTKKIGIDHQAYLRMLGVKTIYLAFDNEEDKLTEERQRVWGAGFSAMRRLQNDIKQMKVEIVFVPGASDPSQCLEKLINATALRKSLRSIERFASIAT
jgi:hypothetical protein